MCKVPAAAGSSVPAVSGLALLHAVTLSATTAKPTVGILPGPDTRMAAVRRHAQSNIDLSTKALPYEVGRAPGGSEREPREREDSVVGLGVATGAIVIDAGAIKLVVTHVLQPELHVEPRPEGWPAIIERNIVEFGDPAVGSRAIVRRYSAEEQRIAGAVDMEIAPGHPDHLII